MWNVYKVKEGKIFAGVCAGLEASGKGDALVYRILVVLFLIFLTPVCLIGYTFLALTMKSAETINEVKEKLAEEDMKLIRGIVEEREITKSKNIKKAINCPRCGAPLPLKGLASRKCIFCDFVS